MNNYTERLKSYWKSENLAFIATYSKYKGNVGFFNDFINPVSKKKLFYPTFDNVLVKNKVVSFYYANGSKLINNHLYKVELDYTDSPNEKNNPYSLEIKKVTPLNQNDIQNHLEGSINEELLKNVFQLKSFIEKDAAKEHIQQRFERRTKDPDSNKIIASLMLEIGAGMYSSKQRMIFELLQNADDAPGKEKVEFHIDVNGEYFFVMHDGAQFSKEDVNAITSAAQSTKKKDKKKTGYKGIGFKSVFTNSTEVWLKSGGYQFAFLRNSLLFSDFDNFYFSSKRYKDNPEFVKEDKLLYAEQREQFNSSTDIPWQIIPIWQDKLPSEFNDSNFNDFDNPVQFALKVGAKHIHSDDGYLAAIDNIVKRPQFLLFLRNTSKFRSPKNRVTVSREDNENLIKIEKSVVQYIGNNSIQNQEKFEYIKKAYQDIKVSNECFSVYNIDLKKSTRIINQKEVFEFVDLNGELIETIPPKLASVTETEISLGIKINNNKIDAEKGYLDNSYEYSSLFTYLPMEDKRFKLPFLVNADFIPDSRRESLQGDNPWNKYIMIKVAEKHVETLEYFAQEFINDNSLNSSYLSLLLMNPLPEDDTAQQIINGYNHKYLEQLKNQKIVVNDTNKTQLLSETIIDNSGLIELFGQEMFYEIIDTDKRLPNSNLDESYLKKYEYLNVEIIDLERLAENINPETCEKLGAIIAEQSLYDESELLKWLNKLVKYIPDNFGKIPFIVHNNALFSLERLVEEADAWLINENTLKHQELIKELGYHTINLNLDKYLNIKEYLHKFNGYINDRNFAYERIAANSTLSILPITTKLKLIDFFQNSDFMLGVGGTKYFGELALFVDESNTARPLQKLISRQEAIEVNSIHKFSIAETEFNSLTEELKKQLINKDKIFTSFILNKDLFNEWSHQFSSEGINVYVNDLKSLYAWVENTDEISSADWASIPWLFINDETRFLTTDKVYWSSAFNELSNEKYEIIKSIFHNSEIKTLPLQACSEIIKTFRLKTDDGSEIEWTKINNLKTLTANTFLDWMENDGNFNDFFEKYTLISEEKGKWSFSEIADTQIFDGSEKELKNYINSKEVLKSLFTELDESLCSENRNKLGLLQGDKLLKAIIESKNYDQNLAIHLPTNLSWSQLNSFISNLPEFNLSTDIIYDANSPEHIIINQLLKIVEDTNTIPDEVQIIIDSLRAKTKINQDTISVYDLSDRIRFGKGENKKELKLSDVLEEYKGESDVLDSITNSFSAINQKVKLQKLIFKTRLLHYDEICLKIEAETSTYYSVHQVVFQLLYKNYNAQRPWPKQHFDDYWKEQGNEKQIVIEYKLFLDVLFDLDYSEISDFEFHDLDLNNCVDKDFAIESEIMPKWLEEWCNNDQSKKTAFISKLGYNDKESPIVKLRKSTISEDYDQNVVTRYFEEAKPNEIIIRNTIEWLLKYSSTTITLNKQLIKDIIEYTTLDSENLNSTIIPIIESVDSANVRVYKLLKVAFKSDLYFIPENEAFAHTIFTTLKDKNKNTLFIDDICGKMSEHFNTVVVELTESINEDLLQKKSALWDEPFYKKWEHYSNCQIFIYDGSEIPYIRTFNDIIINEFKEGLMEEHLGKYYISKILKNSILTQQPSILPEDKLLSLKDWRLLVNENPELIEENPLEEHYNEIFDRMIQDRYGISEERQNDENSNAKRQALYYLKTEGYDVDEGNSQQNYAALYNIKDSTGNSVDFIVRSAKGGLLFLDKEHWDMLEDSNVNLIVIYPGNTPRVFKNRIELLEEELAEKVLFRIPNNKLVSELDGVFNALKSESHMILVTSEKMKESLFSKLKQKGDFNKEENAAVAGDDFKL